MQTYVLFGAKTLDFSKFIYCPQGQGGKGLSWYEHFADRGSFFTILCRCLL